MPPGDATRSRRAGRGIGATGWLPMLLGLAAMTSAMAGCGPRDERQPVSGTVTWQGKPLAKGVITLYPKGAGSTVGCDIIDGKFSIDLHKGATPGAYRVQVVAFRPTGKTEFDVERNAQVDVEEQYLPGRFNTASTLEAEIKAGGKNELAFDLKPEK